MKDKVVNILNEIRPEFDFSEPVTNFHESGMLDSFDMVTLVTMLDDEFAISIDGVDIVPENFDSVEGIVELLAKYVII